MYREFVIKAIIPSSDEPGFYTVYLFTPEEKILLPLTCNKWACESLLLAMQKKLSVRPHVHDTLRRVVLAVGARVAGAYIYRVNDGVFYSYLRVMLDGEVLDIDSKATDAICVALRLDIPIFVSGDVCDEAGIKVTKELLERSIRTDED